jgi:amino acid adenylation domain-containing protein
VINEDQSRSQGSDPLHAVHRHPASAVEAQFFVAQELHPAPGLNTITHAVRLRGALEPERLRACLRRLCVRHEALRIGFEAADGAVVRLVSDEGPVEPLEVRSSSASEAALAEEVETARGPLSPAHPWKAVLLEHGPGDCTFLFAAHRCIWDERSTKRLAAELSALYANDGTVPDLDRASVMPPKAAGDARVLAAMLADTPPLHGLPTRGARGRSRDRAVAELSLELDAATQDAVARSAQAWGVAPFVVQAAAAIHLLAHYGGQDRLAVGLPFETWSGPAEGRPLGGFTSILPVAFDAAAPTFEALVRAFSGQLHRVAEHASTPFESIVRELGARGDASANPVFQIACIEDAPMALSFDGCASEARRVAPPPQQLDVFLRMTPGEVRLVYAPDLIAGDVVESFLRSLSIFLAAALREPTRDLFQLQLLAEDQRERLVGDAKRTAAPALLREDLYELLTRHCSSGGAKVALACAGKQLRYSELAGAVEALAATLAASGASPGALVGVCLPRSVEMVVAILAILRGGGAYVPLDPAFPAQRLEYMVEHSRLSHVVTTKALRSLFDRAGVRVLDMGDDAAATATPPPPAASPPDAAAYVIYTSGSTGRPKGVAVPRRAVSNFLLTMLERPGIGADDTLCAVTTLSFDIAVLELLAPLCAGASVVVATEEEAHDPRLLADLLAAHRATLLQATPVTWQMLCAAGWPGDRSLTALCGGEALTPALAADLVPRVRALWNMYGPTETTVWSTCHRIEDPAIPISVGTPIANTAVYVVDEHMRPVPEGVEGRLLIGGDGVALGYLHDQEQTARRFLPDCFRGEGRMYDTGDRARRDARGALFVVGRSDQQVKLRGFRIELGEVEARLSTQGAVDQVVCAVRRDVPTPELVAYYTLKAGCAEPSVAELRAHCGAVLPGHMVPSRFRRLEAIPRTPNGKVDRAALPSPAVAAAPREVETRPRSEVERALIDTWRSVLGIPAVGVHDNFFELGGTSLAAFTVAAQIGRRLGLELPVLRIFEHATIAALASYLQGSQAYATKIREAYEHAHARRLASPSPTALDVAIVGMAGRFPGARNLDELWKNLSEGRETVTTFRREELDPLVPEQDREDPSYVPARGVLEDIDRFDAAFFGISPSEAELMAPQLRVFLEVAWEAFENAGYVGEKMRGPVGVWAGMGNNFYYVHNVLTRPDKLAIVGEIAAEITNEKDHIAPRVSHKLNLTGPSLSVHTACSTTLVVIDNAYQALVSHQVDAALAGGVDIRTPQKSGQRHEEGGVFSVDGHCRPFDAEATGTMFGEGAGAVVLKRFDDAVRDGDTIHAVIKGTAVNHDGGRKVSYLAPSVEGQARVIASALATADVHPDTISFVEAHGTATPIGDPIEVEALTRVYRTFTQRRQYCAIGSIKGNFGHATTAAGIAGVLKVVLAMRHRKIPPTLHFKTPNPRIDFASSPFFVNDRLVDWAPQGMSRRASVSSFGFCGTNAHVVLEEPPASQATSAPARPAQLVLMSARTRAALDATAERLSASLSGASPSELADAAYTTQVGRKRHEHRRCAVVFRPEEAAAALAQPAGARSASLESDAESPPVAFMFPGQGAQYVNMGLRLYQGERLFRDTIDHCAATLSPELGCDIREFLFPDPTDADRARESLDNTKYTQPAIFVTSYALASLFQSWGIAPSAFIGHSIGEFVAATMGGVMELDDALRLVATRGRLMQALPSGSMLTVRLPVDAIAPRLPAGVDLAAVNGPQLCVVAGPAPLIEALSETLTAEGVACRVLHTSHAFHSSMMDPVVEPFLRVVEGVHLSAPRIPFVSTVTGDWIEASQACSPSYWARHLRSPVQFSKALRILLEDPARVVLECGPRRTSASLALQHRPTNPGRVVASMPDSAEPDDEVPGLLLALGSLWMNGCEVDWTAFHESEARRRVPLPTYPFQRRRFWIEPGSPASLGVDGARAASSAGAVANPEVGVEAQERRAVHEGRDESTSLVVALLEELLGHELEELDEDARFIALGLDSLVLTQLARGVRTRLGLDVSFRQLSEQLSTTRLLADAVRASRSGRSAPVAMKEAVPAPPAPVAVLPAPVSEPVRAEVPTTPAQLEMWLSRLAGPEAGCAYNQAFAVRLRGAVDDAALVRALQALPSLHEALRGHFSDDGERFILEPRIDLAVSRHDLSGLSPAERAGALQRIEEAEARTPYDTEQGPLCRVALVDVGGGERTVLLGVHHGACDGWSLDVLLADLGRLYSGFVGAAPPPAPPRHGFRDFVALRSSPVYAARIAASRTFWRRTLDPLPPPLELPPDGHRPPHRSYRATHALAATPRDEVQSIKAFARAQGLSFFAVMLAGYAALLHRLSGAPDILVGIPVAGHADAGMEDCVGHLVNMVPVRFRFDPKASFATLCRVAHASVLDAREHAAVSFGELVAELGVRRDPSRVPLIAATFTHVQKYGPGKLTFAGCSVDYHLRPREFETFELDLNAIEGQDGLELLIHGNADLFGQPWLQLRLRELQRLLESGVRSPETPIASLQLVPDAERLQLESLNATTTEFPDDACVPQLVEQQARRTPDATAVQCGRRSISYRDLDARANQLSRMLRARGVGRGGLVGLCLERSIEMVVAMLAVLKAGGAYVPLDPAFPSHRLAFMIQDSGLTLLVTESHLVATHAFPGDRTLVLDATAEVLQCESTASLPNDGNAATPEDAAYVLYTSGSTGTPKGVAVPHRAAVNFLASMQREPGMSLEDRLLAVTTLSFDIAFLELVLPLTVGARVIVASRDEAMDGDALARLIEAEHVTMMQATPATWRLLLEAGWRGDPAFKALCGGEALSVELAVRLSERVGQLWNMYGPTETTVWSTCWRVSDPRGGITIGKPIANTSVWILDGALQPCPLGVPGEMYIGGRGVALGYLNRPELTRERFIPDSFSVSPGAKLYRTGDLGRWRVDGQLECLGRTDTQVKVRGFRIELGEIEARLIEHPAVREASVVVRERAAGDARLVAYFAPHAGKNVTYTDLRAQLRAALPDYMVPHAWVEVPRLPRLPNGKVDRKALPAPCDEEMPAAVAVAPRTDAERLVAEVWGQLIGRKAIGVHENFFDAGGHSLLALRAIRVIAERSGVRLSPRLFVVDTLGQIAAQVEKSTNDRSVQSVATPREATEPRGLLGRIKDHLFH